MESIIEFIYQPHAFKSLLLLLGSIGAAYLLSHFVAQLIVRVARFTAKKSDAQTDEAKRLHLRRLETHLSVAIAVVRASIVGIVAFYVWQELSPAASVSSAAIGASAFFIVIAGATIGIVLRDITAGAVMIMERWFDVGDYIRVEPFLDASGVVERITLRSTKIRSLNGEVNWMHNQYMQSVKVTPGGLRAIEVDVFVDSDETGEALIGKVIASIPVGSMTVARAPRILRKEKWADDIWLITVRAKTLPGREWLMEDYFIDSLKTLDAKLFDGKVLIRKPIARYADSAAEKSFRRAIGVK
ncbi:mechanosensitive ion channel family protein [Candidatus Saccharibacteria bacterium]|nr:mechanosensitive ion channel family protein [Candidatus Saccharibacteria bacterium]